MSTTMKYGRDSNGYRIQLHDDDCGIGCDMAAEEMVRISGKTTADVAKLVKIGRNYLRDNGHNPDVWNVTVTRNMVDGTTSAAIDWIGSK